MTTRNRSFSEAELAQFNSVPREVPPASRVPNPIVRLIFSEMIAQGVTYERIDAVSGISFWTLRKWRRGTEPTDAALSRVLHQLGYELRKTAVRIAGKGSSAVGGHNPTP